VQSFAPRRRVPDEVVRTGDQVEARVFEPNLRVKVNLSIRGLHRNDFIMAAKTDALVADSGRVTRDENPEDRVPRVR
jgi:ribosomal protein S1